MTQTTLIAVTNYNLIPWMESQLVGMTGKTPSSSITPSLQVTIARQISH